MSEEFQEFGFHFRRYLAEILLRLRIKQFRMRFIIEVILARTGNVTGIKIVVRKSKLARSELVQQMSVSIQCRIEACFKQAFRFRGGCSEFQNPKWSNLWQNPNEKGEESLSGARVLIMGTPILFVARP